MTPDQMARRLSASLNFLTRGALESATEVQTASTRLKDLFAKNQGGGYINRPIEIRANRINLEANAEAKRSFLKRSNALFQVDSYLASRPWWSGTATQTSNFLQRQRTNILSTDSAATVRRKRIAALEEQYGRSGAESIVAEEDAERVADAQRNRAKARASGRHNVWFDSLEDWEQERFQLTQIYGGGQEGLSAAIKQQEQNAFKKFPWMKTLADAGVIQKKNIPKMAKSLEKLSKTPIIGGLVKHPYMAVASLVVGAMYKYMSYSSNTARLGAMATSVGLPLSRLKSAGHAISDWGGSEKDIASAISGYSTSQGLMMMGLGGTEHLKKDAVALRRNIRGSGRFGFMTSTERMERYSNAIREAYQSGDTERAIALAKLAGFSPAMVEASLKGRDFWTDASFYEFKDSVLGSKSFGEAINRIVDDPTVEIKKSFWNLIRGGMSYGIPGMSQPTLYPHGVSDKVKAADEAARSADKFNTGEYTKDKQSNLGDTYITINTGDLSLPNVTEGKEFAVALTEEATRKSQRAEVLTTFDTMAV